MGQEGNVVSECKIFGIHESKNTLDLITLQALDELHFSGAVVDKSSSNLHIGKVGMGDPPTILQLSTNVDRHGLGCVEGADGSEETGGEHTSSILPCKSLVAASIDVNFSSGTETMQQPELSILDGLLVGDELGVQRHVLDHQSLQFLRLVSGVTISLASASTSYF